MATISVSPRRRPDRNDQRHGLGRLWFRDLHHYPTGATRQWYLGIVVLTTVALYYQNYIGGAVAPQILSTYHMSFVTYAVIIAASNGCGALASLAGGIADKIGRANLVVFGTIVCSLITCLWVPHATTTTSFALALAFSGVTEGIILVATPALVRDFSPQVGRAQAMGMWTMGPVLGSLVVTEVSSHTLDSLPYWQDQFVIAGIVGLVVSAIGLFGLRELDAAQRNRIVGALEAETEAALAARGLDAAEATRHPYRQMLKPDIIASSVAISVFLLFYYTAVGFLPIFFQTVEGFSASESNSLLNWLWGATAVSMLGFGVASDRVRVRKPFMLVGAVMTIVIDLAFIAKIGDGRPSFGSVALVLALSGIWSGAAYVPWMASFTETVERRNPALSATGLAVWGWILRIVVAAAFVALPQVVPSVTPLVNDAAPVQARLAQAEQDFPELMVEAQAHPEVFTKLASYPSSADIPPAVLKTAIETVGAPALTQLQNPKAQADLKYLSGPTATKVQDAKAATASQWKRWLYLCTGGAVLFVPMIFVLTGAWRPRRRRDGAAGGIGSGDPADHPTTATNVLEPTAGVR